MHVRDEWSWRQHWSGSGEGAGRGCIELAPAMLPTGTTGRVPACHAQHPRMQHAAAPPPLPQHLQCLHQLIVRQRGGGGGDLVARPAHKHLRGGGGVEEGWRRGEGGVKEEVKEGWRRGG